MKHLLGALCLLSWLATSAQAQDARIEPRGRAAALVKVAIVTSVEIDVARNAQDLSLVKLGADKNISLLDRSTVEKLLREQKLSLSGLVDASTALKAGKFLAVDLLAVVEYSDATKQNAGVVIFDAASGVKLVDSGFASASLEPQAMHVAASVRMAVAKWRLGTKNLKTLCFMPVRNADLPRSLDHFCEALGAMLERESLSFQATAVLERKRLDLVNKEKALAQDAVTRELMASLVVVEMEVSRGKHGKGIRATVTLRDNAGKELQRIAHEVDDPTGAGLLAPLSEKVQQALKTTAIDAKANRDRESQRFLREAQLLWNHKHYVRGLQAAEAAYALQPEDAARHLLAEYLLNSATDAIHDRSLYGNPFKVTPEKLRVGMDLAQRGLQLLDAGRYSNERIKEYWLGKDDWQELEPFEVISARRLFFNKLDNVRIVPENAQAQREFDDFRLFCLQQTLDRCRAGLGASPRNARTLKRFTYLMRKSAENVIWSAPTPRLRAEALHGLSLTWLDLAGAIRPEEIPDDSAAQFGIFLRSIGASDEGLGTPALDVARKSPHPIVRLHAVHAIVQLGLKQGKLPRHEAIARHREAFAEGMRLIDAPPFAAPHERFRVTMYTLWNSVIGSLYSNKARAEVLPMYFEMCDFMLARGDLVEQVVRDTVGHIRFGDATRQENLKALQIIDKALHVARSPRAAAYYSAADGFKHAMTEARREVLKELPDLAKVTLPWESVKTLVGARELEAMKAELIISALVHDKNVYVFTGGDDPTGKYRQLQLVRIPLEGGAFQVLGKTLVGLQSPERGARVFSNDGHSFVTSTAIANGRLYAGTVTDGIVVFPLAGGAPTRIGEKEGLPSPFVTKLVIVKEKLVAALDGGYLISYDLGTGRCDTLASSRRSQKLSPFDDSAPFRLGEMTADAKRSRVLFNFGTVANNGLWEFNTQTRQFKKLHPVIGGAWSPVIDDRFYVYYSGGKYFHYLLAYDLANDQFTLLDGKAQREFSGLKPKGMPAHLSAPFRNCLFLGEAHSLLHQGSLWTVRPFGRHSLDGKAEEIYPSLRDQKEANAFAPRVSLQAVTSTELLIGDISGLYLVRLKAKSAQGKPGGETSP
jgi:hypothetical protein